MNKTSGVVRSFFERLTSPEVLTQFVALVFAALLAVAIAAVIKTWHRTKRVPPPRASLWQERLLEICVILSPFFFALALLLAERLLFASFRMPATVLDTALQLVSALILVRLGVYVLKQLVGEKSWIKGWQNRLTWVIWLAISFELLGWFDGVERTLDAIDLVPGKTTFSLWSLLKGIVVVTGFMIVTSLIARTIENRVMKLDAIAMSTRIGISKFSYFFLVSLGILLGISSAGIDITILSVFGGAIGLGLGFGLQAIASNFVSGFVLLLDKSIKPGDVISFTGTTGTSTENFGWVQELRGRYIVVRDRDGVETLVPNQHVITNSVINWSYSDARVRLRVPVMVSFQDDPEAALKLLLEATAGHPRILRDPAPVTRLMAFEDFGMRLEVRFWIADAMNGVNDVRSDVNRAIFRLFRDAGIKIPVAQREIRIVSSSHADSNLAPDHDSRR